MIQVSVTVTYDTLTGALCHGSISVTNYTMISMYQMLQSRVPYAVLCGIVWGFRVLYHLYLTSDSMLAKSTNDTDLCNMNKKPLYVFCNIYNVLRIICNTHQMSIIWVHFM